MNIRQFHIELEGDSVLLGHIGRGVAQSSQPQDRGVLSRCNSQHAGREIGSVAGYAFDSTTAASWLRGDRMKSVGITDII